MDEADGRFADSRFIECASGLPFAFAIRYVGMLLVLLESLG